jgi:hypothetical protein
MKQACAGPRARAAGAAPRRAAAAPRAAAARRPVAAAAPPAASPVILVPMGKVHTIRPERLELIGSLDAFAAERVLPILKPVEQCWQPQDFLPDPASPDFLEEVRELRKRSGQLPDAYYVTLVGDMITEEALPTYMAMINTLDGVRDETGAAPTPWGQWTRAWVAEENRHGDLLNKYCWLTGRVDMRAVEVTIQRLIGSGMDPKTENNPYLGFVYTSFQARFISIWVLLSSGWLVGYWLNKIINMTPSSARCRRSPAPLSTAAGARDQGLARQHRAPGHRARRRAARQDLRRDRGRRVASRDRLHAYRRRALPPRRRRRDARLRGHDAQANRHARAPHGRHAPRRGQPRTQPLPRLLRGR